MTINYNFGHELFHPYEVGNRVALYYPLSFQKGVEHGVSVGTVLQRGVNPVVSVDGVGVFPFMHFQTRFIKQN